jgi:Tat protein secretion system quality control protein TatD with DNase activity
VPHRGARNEPGFVALVGAFVASLRGLDPAELAAKSSSAAAVAFALGTV